MTDRRSLLSRERGTIRKDPGGRLRVALAYPNSYSLGMSNLGFQTLYRLFNEIPWCVCERVFLLPKAELAGKKLTSFETATPLSDFDLVAFSLPFEEDYPNIVRMLELSGIEPLASERSAADREGAGPLVMAGGCAVTLNPEPIADFMDLFFIGEAEAAIGPLMDVLKDLIGRSNDKETLLKTLSTLEGVYVPGFYDFAFEGAVVKGISVKAGAPSQVKRVVADVSATPVPRSVVLSPDTEFADTTLIEVERGCPRGCRFCSAGFMYLPPRWRDLGDLKDAVTRALEEAKGFGRAPWHPSHAKVGLIGAAVSEYPYIKELLRFVLESGAKATLSSLRADFIDAELLTLLKEAGLRTLTLAPEAGSERLRRVVNKDIPDDVLMEAAALSTEAGFKRLKLYFMVGLPSETDSDVLAIADLAKRIGKELRGGRLSLSVNPFIPKPVTPFQFHPFERIEIIERRYGILKDALKGTGGVELRTYPVSAALVQALVSRGDRRLSILIREAARTGWKRALKKTAREAGGKAGARAGEDTFGAKIGEYIYRERQADEILPWEVIAHGIEKGYLRREYLRGLGGAITGPCVVEQCTRCGVC